mgnify:CR=1 FL=1
MDLTLLQAVDQPVSREQQCELVTSLAEGLAQQGDPTLSNRDVLTFNALVHAMHSFILHMQALDRRIEDVLVMRQPLDLRRVNYV